MINVFFFCLKETYSGVCLFVCDDGSCSLKMTPDNHWIFSCLWERINPWIFVAQNLYLIQRCQNKTKIWTSSLRICCSLLGLGKLVKNPELDNLHVTAFISATLWADDESGGENYDWFEDDGEAVCSDIWITGFDNVKSLEWKMAINNPPATTSTHTDDWCVRLHPATSRFVHPHKYTSSVA